MPRWEIDTRWGMMRCVPDGRVADADDWYSRLMDELKKCGFNEKEVIKNGNDH